MSTEKNSLYDYLEWRGELTFDQAPFNEVDALIFAIFSYMDFSVLPGAAAFLPETAPKIRTAYENIPDDFLNNKNSTFKSMFSVSSSAAKTRRFGSIPVFGFEAGLNKEISMQFSAVTFLLPDKTAVIAFRGTDGSIVGWKEDFHISFTSGVPAQLKAGDYAKRVSALLPLSPLIITGHSKGGNLAVWAAAHLDTLSQDKIVSIYDNDGPGFCCDFIESANYLRISEKIKKYVPASSIVGMLLETDVKAAIIQSSQKGLLQHLPESWDVSGEKFIYLEERSKFGNYSDNVINSWAATLTYDERKALSDIISDILDAADVTSFKDLESSPAHIAYAAKAFAGMDKQKRQMLGGFIKRLIQEIFPSAK